MKMTMKMMISDQKNFEGRKTRKRRRGRRSLAATGRLKTPAGSTAEPGHVTRILLTFDPDVKMHGKALP